MRLVVQRVNAASVSVKEKVIGKIDKGLFILVGVAEGDTKGNAEELAEKLSKLRIMADDQDKMNLSVLDTDASVLVVSQFTLYASTKKGNRPSFTKAANPRIAKKVYNHFINELKKRKIKVETGEFGSFMKIEVELDGPVTILVDSPPATPDAVGYGGQVASSM